MDKNEYKVRLEEIKAFFEKKQYHSALGLVQTINWQKVKNARVLCMVADIYSENGQFGKAEAILNIAEERGGSPKEVLYRLTRVAVDRKDFETALERHRRFTKVYSEDNRKYLLKFFIHRAQGASVTELIEILEPYRHLEAPEQRWLYTLATLYEQAGQENKAVALCDEIFLWFHDGEYVIKALELKKRFNSLTDAQQRLLNDSAEEEPEEDEDIDYTSADGLVAELGEGWKNQLAADVRELTEPVLKNRLNEETFNEEDHDVGSGFSQFEIDLTNHEAGAADASAAGTQTEEDDQIPGQMSIDQMIANIQKHKLEQERARQEAERLAREARERLQAEMEQVRADIDEIDQQIGSHEEAIVQLRGEKKRLEEALDELMTRELPVVTVTASRQTEAEDADEVHAPESKTVEDIEAVEEAEAVEEELAAAGTDEEEEAVEAADAAEEAVEETEEAADETEAESVTEGAAVLQEAQGVDTALPKINNPFVKSDHIAEIAARLEQRFGGTAETPVGSAVTESGVDVSLVAQALQEEETKSRLQAEQLAAVPKVASEAEQTDGELKSLAQLRDSTDQMLADIETDVLSHTQEIRLGRRGEKKDLVAPIGVKNGEEVTPLTEEQKRTLGYFGPVQGIPEQVATVLDEIHKRGLDAKTSSRGNIIVMGRQGSGKTTLAVNVLKAIEQEKGNTNSPLRVATIDAKWLNENDVAATIDQIAGGGLIIERASELDDSTIEALAAGLGMRTDGLTVILEDNKKDIARLMERNEEFAHRFTSQIVVPVFSNHELVSFGRTYALEQGYVIEDKAMLELYSLVGDMQRDGHPVTVNDVKEVMDEAIEHASRFRLFKKRKTDKDGFVILTENDFE
ncbi:MAG: hypothetical protein PUH12_05395 [Lachnospiraceae bacterium]|nr:hypothetical protein [Lachnospiraceae bacterium]